MQHGRHAADSVTHVGRRAEGELAGFESEALGQWSEFVAVASGEHRLQAALNGVLGGELSGVSTCAVGSGMPFRFVPHREVRW